MKTNVECIRCCSITAGTLFYFLPFTEYTCAMLELECGYLNNS